MSAHYSVISTPPSRATRVISLCLRILAAAAFLAAGGAKLAGVSIMVDIFNHIGIGQWFRTVTGIVEIAGGILILLPPTAALGGLLLAITMSVAVLVHLLVIGGSPVPAVGLLLITSTVVWLHRSSLQTGGDKR
jgi:putative oxidoreductase